MDDQPVAPPSGDGTEFELQNESGSHVTVFHESDPVARYRYAYDPRAEGRHETAKPFLHVLDPETGTPITNGPDGDTYPHHRGIFIGWNELGVEDETYDFWHMDDSNIVHQRFDGLDRFPETQTLTSETEWITESGETVLTETRTQRFRAPPMEEGIVVVDFTATLTPTDRAVELEGDPEHAGVQYRAHDAVAENESAEYVFPPGAFEESDPGTEAIEAEEGLPWAALTYRIDDREYLVQQMNHPENPPETTYSAYRSYGRFGAFFETALPANESLSVRYRFLIGRGSASPEDLDRQYSAFAGR